MGYQKELIAQQLGYAAKSFEKHVATFESYTTEKHGKVYLLSWEQPGTSVYAIYYVLTRGCLMVYGDMGEAIYRWTGNCDYEWIAQCNIGYFEGKLCGVNGRGHSGHSWDHKAVEEEMDEFLKDASEEAKDILDDWKGHIGSPDEWMIYCWDNLEHLEEMGEAGWVTDIRVIFHLEGIKHAVAQLAKQSVPEKPTEA